MRFYPRIGSTARHLPAFVAASLLSLVPPAQAAAPEPAGIVPEATVPEGGSAASERGASPADTLAFGLGSGLEIAARAAAVTGALLTADLVVRRVAEASQGGGADEVAGRVKWLGTWRSSAPVYLVGGAALGFALDGTDGLKKLLGVAAGAVAGSTANEIVNVGIGRHRPRHDHGSLSFRPLRGHASFPSGHTAFVFAMAGAVDEVTEGPLPAVLAYGAATLTGLSRIYHDSHWFSDVAVGAAIGVTVSRAATRETMRRLDGKGLEEGREGPTLVAAPGYVGVRLRF